jgi:hypothetical protein
MVVTKQGRLTRVPEFEESDGKNLPRPIEDVWALVDNVQVETVEEEPDPADPSNSPTYGQHNEELL